MKQHVFQHIMGFGTLQIMAKDLKLAKTKLKLITHHSKDWKYDSKMSKAVNAFAKALIQKIEKG